MQDSFDFKFPLTFLIPEIRIEMTGDSNFDALILWRYSSLFQTEHLRGE